MELQQVFIFIQFNLLLFFSEQKQFKPILNSLIIDLIIDLIHKAQRYWPSAITRACFKSRSTQNFI